MDIVYQIQSQILFLLQFGWVSALPFLLKPILRISADSMNSQNCTLIALNKSIMTEVDHKLSLQNLDNFIEISMAIPYPA